MIFFLNEIAIELVWAGKAYKTRRGNHENPDGVALHVSFCSCFALNWLTLEMAEGAVGVSFMWGGQRQAPWAGLARLMSFPGTCILSWRVLTSTCFLMSQPHESEGFYWDLKVQSPLPIVWTCLPFSLDIFFFVINIANSCPESVLVDQDPLL